MKWKNWPVKTTAIEYLIFNVTEIVVFLWTFWIYNRHAVQTGTSFAFVELNNVYLIISWQLELELNFHICGNSMQPISSPYPYPYIIHFSKKRRTMMQSIITVCQQNNTSFFPIKGKRNWSDHSYLDLDTQTQFITINISTFQ